MFCGECGTKNEVNSAFCSECGAKLEQNVALEEAKNVVKPPRKPMSKSTKIVIIVVAFVVVAISVFFIIGSKLTSPEVIAKDYIKAVVEQDANKLYNYLDLEGDKTFVTKKMYSDLMKENGITTDVVNYKITEVEYNDSKLNAEVEFEYTTKNSTSEKEGTVYLTKLKNKKFLFFDNWQVSSENSLANVIENYTIMVPKNSKLTYGGVKVDSKYLDKDKSTTTLDAYVLPQVFATKTTVKAVLTNGMTIEEEVTPSSYYSHTVKFDEDSLSASAKSKIIDTAKKSLTTIYTNAIAKKSFSDIKSNFEHKGTNLKDLEEEYTELVNDLSSASNTLTSITFTDVSIYDMELNEDGYLEVEVKAKYNYAVKYKTFSDEEKTNEDSDYSYMTVILTEDAGKYYLVDLDDLETYFSRY